MFFPIFTHNDKIIVKLGVGPRSRGVFRMMQKNYKIGELAKLFKISTDTLRFYEKEGLLIPKRESNGYRMYSIFDIWKLNVISTMKSLGVELKDIKVFLNDRSVQKEKEILELELDYLEDKIKHLEYQKIELTNRLNLLNDATNNTTYNEVQIEVLQNRKIIYLDYEFTNDNEIDLAFSSLSQRFDDIIYFFNRDFGMILPLEKVLIGKYNEYRRGFLIVDDNMEKYDTTIDAGKCLIFRHRGPYENIDIAYSKILAFAKSNNLELSSEVIERYLIDRNQTSRPDEYLTEIQIAVLNE